MNAQKLKGKLAERKMSTLDIANALKINRSTVYLKFKNDNFTTNEATKIVSMLKLTKDEAIDIFLPVYVA